MLRSVLLALLLIASAVRPQRGEAVRGGRVDQRIARSTELTSSEAPGLAHRADTHSLARTVVDRRSGSNGVGGASAWPWRNVATSSPLDPASATSGHGGAWRTRRVPWPFQDAPYEATAPPDGTLTS